MNAPAPTVGVVTESITPVPPIAGLAEVPTTIPLVVTFAPPFEMMFPANVTDEVVTLVFVPVATVGALGKNTSILSIAHPSGVFTEPSEAKRNLIFTFDLPATPGIVV